MSKPIKPLYVGAVLSRDSLKNTPFEGMESWEGVKVHAHHVTLSFFKKGRSEHLDPWKEHLGREVTVRPKTVITTDKVVFCEVEVEGAPPSLCKPNLHLTIATKNGGSPKDSNEVLSAIYGESSVEGITVVPWAGKTFTARIGWRCVRTQQDFFEMEVTNA